MKYLITIILISALSANVLSQSSVEALRYSVINTGGTARYIGLGGAFSAVGADFTTTSINPAGIGLYQGSEVTITPAVHNTSTEAIYNGNITNSSKNNFHLGNLGIVYATPLKSRPPVKGWRHFQFAGGINRLKDFNNNISMSGPNPDNSFLDTYVEVAEGPPQIPKENIEQGYQYSYDLTLAWWTWLLDVYGDSVNYNYWQPVYYGGAWQSKTLETKGSMNEVVFSAGGNYNDQFYFGVTLAFPFFKYKETSYYNEYDHADTIYEFSRFERVEYLETKGTGINLKLGMIYRPSNFIRLGLAIHTPSYFFKMKDYYWASMESWYDFQVGGDSVHYDLSPNGNFDYKLTTPFRTTAGIAFIIGGNGLLSADYEFTDFSMARFNSNSYDYTDENKDISESYGVSHNIRVGTEWRVNMISFRAGVNLLTSPYKNGINFGDRKSLSLGAGYRSDYFFMDLAFRYTMTKADYYFYYTSGVQPNPVSNSYKTYDILLTAGFRF